MSTSLQLFATAPKGIASLLVDELRALGALNVAETRAGAAFEGDQELAYRACLWLRTANRVLLPLARFAAASPEALYAGVQSVDWGGHMDAAGTLAVDFSTSGSRIRHSHFGALKVKDAIVDQFRDRCGQRPSVELQRPDLRINVYLHRDQATVSIDLSGESLHRRGYRADTVAAPLKENLAAAILLRAGWPQVAAAGGALLDPMCGSGTLPIEAALMAGDVAPGLLRDYFGFLAWKGHAPDTWAALLEEARQRREAGLASLPPIVGYDADRGAIRAALENLARAGLSGRVHAERRDLERLQPVGEVPGLVVANPPYGERLGDAEQLKPLYAGLGEILRQRFHGWRAAVFTGNPDLAKQMGLRARRLHKLYNGAIECRLLHFEVDPQWFVAPGPRPLVPPPAAPEQWSDGARMFANRLRKNLRELGRWARRAGVTCYRVYDADMPEYALAIDLYQEADADQRWAHVQEYQAPPSVDARQAGRRLRDALAVVPTVMDLPAEHLFFKVRSRQKGGEQYRKQAAERRFHRVQEGAYLFEVNFTDYLDTGLFLDHRATRRLVGELAGGRRCLNLFAYTGTASVYAAGGGASAVTTVDLSNTYLDWARRNMALNGFTGADYRFIQADCLAWLQEQAGDSRAPRYGLIFLDPPTHSRSKRMHTDFDVQRDQVTLLRQAAGLLEDDGVLIFSNNFRKFRLDAAALPELHIEDITAATIPRDFARNPRIHNCWRISRA
ncbi:MAG: bifunctional 23S rRNA (guanine(2069)-N(7))-methyltransferase RlmK/23S rRNA (guanine(2445)-N(2))-methyltransferase RlmL [Gammaproteobacteria bacterium]